MEQEPTIHNYINEDIVQTRKQGELWKYSYSHLSQSDKTADSQLLNSNQNHSNHKAAQGLELPFADWDARSIVVAMH